MSPQVNPLTAAFYDAVLMYASALNASLSSRSDVKDGRKLVRSLWGQLFVNGRLAVFVL